jgi:hypothetical protein
MDYNTPRLWGLRSADGFSPSESGEMRNLRRTLATPPDGRIPSINDFVSYCKLAAATWIYTTAERCDEMKKLDLPVDVVSSWGQSNEIVLLRVKQVEEAEIVGPLKNASDSRPNVVQTWRLYPGKIRVDLVPGADSVLLVRETYAKGWTAMNQADHELLVRPLLDAFLGVEIPAGTSEVRLTYQPVGWRIGLKLAICGLLAILLVSVMPEGKQKKGNRVTP